MMIKGEKDRQKKTTNESVMSVPQIFTERTLKCVIFFDDYLAFIVTEFTKNLAKHIFIKSML